jgi:hypothetical protein
MFRIALDSGASSDKRESPHEKTFYCCRTAARDRFDLPRPNDAESASPSSKARCAGSDEEICNEVQNDDGSHHGAVQGRLQAQQYEVDELIEIQVQTLLPHNDDEAKNENDVKRSSGRNRPQKAVGFFAA